MYIYTYIHNTHTNYIPPHRVPPRDLAAAGPDHDEGQYIVDKYTIYIYI